MTKRNAQVYDELQRTTAQYEAVMAQHDSAKQQAEALARERELLRRRVLELGEQAHTAPLLELVQQLAPLVQLAADDCFFACLVCRERFPYAIFFGDSQPQQPAALADLARWLGSWQMRFPCGHSLCRLCYERSLKAVFMPSFFSSSSGLGVACPLCKKPRHVFLLEDDDNSWGADDELLQVGDALHITTAPCADSSSDDGEFIPPSALSTHTTDSISNSGSDVSDTF